jgi:Ca-activated chloride channel family protein
MPQRSSAVATHRQQRGQWWTRPITWIAVGVVGLSATGAVLLVRAQPTAPTCTGPASTLTIASSSAQFPALTSLARSWTESVPAVDGRCVGVTVALKESSQVAAALGAWDEARDGARPDVWIPDSSLWVLIASSRPDTKDMLPVDPPSIATSPVVLALRRTVAQALGWPQRKLGWDDVLGAFSRPDMWTGLGHPELAQLRLGMTDPTVSTAGLAFILMVLDRDADGVLSDAELTSGVGFSQMLDGFAADTSALVSGQQDSPVAVFPALEREVAVHDLTKPAVELVPVYAHQAPIVMDFPYAVLTTSWVDNLDRAVANQFLQYVRGPQGRKVLSAEGFRGPDQGIGPEADLPSELGFEAGVATARANPAPEALSQLITDWTALQRQSNILAVLDTSGSMDEAVSGTGLTRLQLLQQTAVAGFGLLNTQSNIGLWQFSLNQTPTSDYRELVPYGPLSGTVGPVPRRQALIGAVQGLRAGGGTGLYDTTYAAFKAIQAHWEPNDTNAILLITDGKDQDDNSIGLAELLRRLTQEMQPDRPTPIISIAVGPDADAEALRQISRVTGGRTFVVRDANAAVQTLILAFAGRLR